MYTMVKGMEQIFALCPNNLFRYSISFFRVYTKLETEPIGDVAPQLYYLFFLLGFFAISLYTLIAAIDPSLTAVAT